MINKLRRYFLSGLVIFLPIALTIYIFFLAINFGEKVLGKYIEPVLHENFGFYFKGLSIFIGIWLIIVIGFLATHFLGRTIYQYIDRVLTRLPVFRQVYPALKEMAMFLFSSDRVSSFQRTVLVEYPRKGVFSYGFLTSESSEKVRQQTKKDLCNIFIPNSPTPFTGFVIMVPKSDIIFTEIGVEEAIKFIVSAGVVNPH